MGSNLSTAYFHIICISLQQAKITSEVLNGRFSSLTTVFLSASYPRGGKSSSSVPVVVLWG